MALLLCLTGSRDAVFYAVPLFGAAFVLLTAVLGKQLHSWPLGAGAALLLASSPSFLLQVTQPVSDVPAAAWWTLSLACALSSRAWAAPLGGIAAAMAILTRPNLVPLAAVLGGFHLWKSLPVAGEGRRREITRTALFSIPVAAGCFMVAAFNQYLYGSPLASGYAPLAELYQWRHVGPNLDRYPRWLLQTQTPFIYLALPAPWLTERRTGARLLSIFAAVVFCVYIPYGYFGREDWGYLRFLLPAYPSLIVLSLVTGSAFVQRAVRRPVLAAYVAASLVAAFVFWEARYAVTHGSLSLRPIEQRYVEVGRYINAAIPPDAVLIAGLHAGSIRYYGGRLTIYYPSLHFRELDRAVAALTSMGRPTFIVLEEGEEAHFKWLFAASNESGRLDWPPAMKTYRGVPVRIYDSADRARFMSGQPVVTYDIANSKRPIVTQK
jgi:hypothetical protein